MCFVLFIIILSSLNRVHTWNRPFSKPRLRIWIRLQAPSSRLWEHARAGRGPKLHPQRNLEPKPWFRTGVGRCDTSVEGSISMFCQSAAKSRAGFKHHCTMFLSSFFSSLLQVKKPVKFELFNKQLLQRWAEDVEGRGLGVIATTAGESG